MTSEAATLRPTRTSIMLCVIELNVKTLVELCGKTLERRITAVHIGMTNDAHRNRRSCKLRKVTVSACLVAGKSWGGRVVAASVTRSARDRRVTLTPVNEF